MGSKDSQPSLSTKIEEYLFKVIQEQNLHAGDLIPSEIQTVKDLSISRGIVRETYKSLATLGLIEIQNGKRPKIKEIDTNGLSLLLKFHTQSGQISPNQILETLRGIELSCVQLAAVRINKHYKNKLSEIMQNVEENSDNLTIFFTAFSLFHKLIVKAAQNPLYELFFTASQSQLDLILNTQFLLLTKKERKKIIKIHKNILEAIFDAKPSDAAYAFIEYADKLKTLLKDYA